MMKSGLFSRSGEAVALRAVDVRGEVFGAHARVSVRQTYRNDEARAIEAVYTFPLPADAVLSGFAMTVGDRRCEGVVKEREAAFKTYDDAVVAGHGAALVEQERSNVFTATVGNLLPGEETVIELEYLQKVQADEGTVRWMIPTLVAPRYIPGAPSGDRTAHGSREPTDRVADADRISPKAGAADYKLTLDLTLDLGRDVEVESPSHTLVIERAGRVTHVRFGQRDVSLDRDVVVLVRDAADGPFATVSAHRVEGAPGVFSLGVVPDLFGRAATGRGNDVIFAIDTSGSMEGTSITEARAALRLCLRHLRDGDRFNVVAFSDSARWLTRAPQAFNQRALEQADRWVAALNANGGTELLAPMVDAVRMAPDGVVVLLTDGQVGNEAEILRAVLDARKTARVYSFGIGTNVSDALLRDLARHTRASVEFIHPGERIEEKVVSVFARAVAPRVTDVHVEFDGVDAGEIAPSTLPDLVDGEPWAVFGRYDSPGVGRALLRGTLQGEPWTLTVPVALPTEASRPALSKLWAAERVRDLEGATLTDPRRAAAMKDRVVALAVEHGIASKYTSFVVVETRSGARRTSGMPETRVVPVNLPAGWAMFDAQRQEQLRGAFTGGIKRKVSVVYGAMPSQPQSVGSAGMRGGPAVASRAKRAAPPPAPAPMAKPSMPSPSMPQRWPGMPPRDAFGPSGGPADGGFVSRDDAFSDDLDAGFDAMPAEMDCEAPAEAIRDVGDAMGEMSRRQAPSESVKSAKESVASTSALMQSQLASGLWAGADDAAKVRATALALASLVREGITAAHPMYGAQVRKAVEALISLVDALGPARTSLAAFALAAAWLCSTGHRTRKAIEQAASGVAGLSDRLLDEPRLRADLDALEAAARAES